MAASSQAMLANSKAQAEADAKTILGANTASILTNSTTTQPPASIMPNPGKHLATVSGKLPLSQAKDTANNALNVALASTDVHLTKIGSTFSLGTAKSVTAQANAESDLRRQLALQGYTATQINAAITMLKGISNAVGSQTTSNGLSIPSDSAKGISLGTTVTLGLPNDSSTSLAAPLTSNSVIYSNTDESTDTVVKAVNSQTLETYHIIRAKDAPDTFMYSLNNLPSGVLLKQVDTQTVEAYLPAKTYGQTTTPETVVALIKAPWAKDANGVSVPTYLTIGTSNTVVLHVLHKNGNFLYPIVADPFAWWGWHGFMYWADDWTINHYLGASVVASGIAGALSWGVASAVIGAIGGVAAWCEGRNGATFYFNFVPWYPYVQFAGCSQW